MASDAPAWALALLREARVGRLATADADVRENPQVSVVVDQYDEDWTRLCYVIVEGRAEIVEAGPLRERAIDLLLAKYPQYLALGLAAGDGPVIVIAVERIVAWRFA